MGCGLFFACYRGLVICEWTKNAKYEYCWVARYRMGDILGGFACY